jgi:exonuclease III
MPGGDIGIINIYAPNETTKCAQLWEAMIETLSQTYRWIFMGDYNMVKTKQDKTNPCGRLISNRERVIFQTLKQRFGVTDYPHST